MEIEDLIKTIKIIELKSRKKIGGNLSSSYRNLFKGKGLSFSGVREYSYGDDVRLIEWNTSARMNSLYIKNLMEERELNVYVALDISNSMFLGTTERTKFELGSILSTMILFSAIYNGDRCSLILFSKEDFYYSNLARRSEEVFTFLNKIIKIHREEKVRRDDFENLYLFLTKKIKKRGIVFLISDFIYSSIPAQFFSTIPKIHDLVCIGVLDKIEYKLPDVKIFSAKDPETQDTTLSFISNKKRKVYEAKIENKINALKDKFNTYGIRGDFITLSPESEIKFLEILFK